MTDDFELPETFDPGATKAPDFVPIPIGWYQAQIVEALSQTPATAA